MSSNITSVFAGSHGELLQGDCIHFLKSQGDNTFDLTLSDPPYGTNIMNRNPERTSKLYPDVTSYDYGKYEWDIVPPPRYFREIRRVSKNQVIFGFQYFTKILPPPQCVICWDKMNGKSSFGDCELAWTSFETANKVYRYMWNGIIQEEYITWKREKRIHPNQKPVPLLVGILKDFAPQVAAILDPYAGSCATAIACEILGLKWVCIEREEEYCLKAKERFEEFSKQKKLFKTGG
ncbi:MAG: site-specific DNA-methyltransferase [Candidatus Aminicenantes bacterium]|nr:site-specific DNA-methyltransferase [Candidatus Aminicenantes bacterium]